MSDPMENWRRQQEQIRRSMIGPLRTFAANQRAMDAALQSPMRDALNSVAAASQVMEPTLAKMEANQQALRKALEPINVLTQDQARIQQLLAGPVAGLEQLQRWVQANTDQLRVIQNSLAVAMRQAATDLEDAPADAAAGPQDDAQTSWLRSWSAALTDWSPSAEQAEKLLSVLAFLIALALYQQHLAVPEQTAAMMEPIGLLFSAGALLIAFTRR